MEKFTVKALWGGRVEGLEPCLDRMSMFMNALDALHSVLGHWDAPVPNYGSRSWRAMSVNEHRSHWRDWLKKHRVKDDGGGVMETLGYSFWLRNLSNRACEIRFAINRNPESERLHNSVKFVAPLDWAAKELPLDDNDFRRSFLKNFVDSWDPDWGNLGLLSFNLEQFEQTQNAKIPEVNWLTYINSKKVVEPDRSKAIASSMNRGTLIEILKSSEHDIDSRIFDVRAGMEEAGDLYMFV